MHGTYKVTWSEQYTRPSLGDENSYWVDIRFMNPLLSNFLFNERNIPAPINMFTGSQPSFLNLDLESMNIILGNKLKKFEVI